jgi:hypothetical protein
VLRVGDAEVAEGARSAGGARMAGGAKVAGVKGHGAESDGESDKGTRIKVSGVWNSMHVMLVAQRCHNHK